MKPVGSLVVLLGSLAVLGHAQEVPFRTLIRAEEEFARVSREHGVRAAFLEFLGDSGIIFRPGPVNGKSVWRARPNPMARLSWYPEDAGISSDGRLGWTMGPWELSDTTGAHSVVSACGHYLSVWAPDSLGRWKVLLDAGVDHDCPPEPPPRLSAEAAPGSQHTLPGDPQSNALVLSCEKEFEAFATASGTHAAYGKYGADDIRFLRSGLMPVRGIVPWRVSPADGKGRSVWAPIGGGLGKAGDLGYVYGEYRRSREERVDGPAERGCFIRVWERLAGGEWKIAVDLENPYGGK